MPKKGPILIIEDDFDDQDILKEVFEDLQIPNTILFFGTCMEALDYLLSATEKPFLIISDINLPAMTGLQLKKQINNNDYLRNKCIPFIFLSTSPDHLAITTAYDVQAQGYFIKPPRIGELKEMMALIIGYWKFCSNPSHPVICNS